MERIIQIEQAFTVVQTVVLFIAWRRKGRGKTHETMPEDLC